MKTCKLCHRPTYKLDDWDDDWDYEAVLSKYEVTVERSIDRGYCLTWKHGFMHIPTDDKIHAKKAAALFVELFLRGVSASFSDKLMDGYLGVLEIQEP